MTAQNCDVARPKLTQLSNGRLGLVLLPPQFLRPPEMATNMPGSAVAGTECCRALLQHSPGEICLFVREADQEALQRDLAHLAEVEGPYMPAVSIVPTGEMAGALADGSLTALHNLGGAQLDLVAYARSAFSSRLFPVTCMEYGFSFQPFLLDALSHLLLVPTYPCDAMVCTTQAAARATASILERLAGELEWEWGVTRRWQFQLPVIPHGVPTDIFKPRDKADVRRQLELPQDRLLILYMGRVDPTSKSDVTPLLMAFQQLAARHGDRPRLLLAGPVGDRYQQKLESAVSALGLPRASILQRTNLPKASVALYYSAADIFVSLSDTLQENFGLTPVEAMASGLPAVVSGWAGYQESVVDGVTGFKIPAVWSRCDEDLDLFAPFYDWTSDHFYVGQSIAVDVEALTDRLERLVADDSLRLEMAAAARRHVQENYTWRRAVSMLWELWRELSQTALELEPLAPCSYDLPQPRYFDTFGHFAPRHLDPALPVHLTDRGRRVVSGKEPLLLLEEPRGLLSSERVMKVLRVLRILARLRQRITAGQLEDILARKHGIAPAAARRHLMWMLKYDLATIPLK